MLIIHNTLCPCGKCHTISRLGDIPMGSYFSFVADITDCLEQNLVYCKATEHTFYSVFIYGRSYKVIDFRDHEVVSLDLGVKIAAT